MRFGGHETFPIREGWIYKGLDLLINDPAKLTDEYSADWLGVGRNMAKSIRHWLIAAGLAHVSGTARRPSHYQPTLLGKLIYERDRYCLELGTWWVLHAKLVANPDLAMSWHWFFNRFRTSRFEKAVALEGLKRFVSSQSRRLPSHRTLERDLGCLLASYARKIPPLSDDPEEALDCPMTELDLLAHYRDTGTYALNLGPKAIPSEILAYAFGEAFRQDLSGRPYADIPLRDAVTKMNGPGAAFALSAESMFETIERESGPDTGLQIVGLASQRAVRVTAQEPLQWLKLYYERLGAESHAA